jgi:hypothetical protein
MMKIVDGVFAWIAALAVTIAHAADPPRRVGMLNYSDARDVRMAQFRHAL